MTLATISVQPEPATVLRPLPWRRMAWVTWRQHRTAFIAVPAVLGAIALFLLVAGLKIHHDYAVLLACQAKAADDCGNLNSAFNHTDWTVGNAVDIFSSLVP